MAAFPEYKGVDFKLASLVIAPVICLIFLLFTDLEPGKPQITYTFAIALLMAIWWITEAVPLAVTSLLPIVLFPLFGVLDGKTVSATYFNHVIFLFIGGFMMALAMEKWNLHKRIALKTLLLFGVSPGRILFGFILATAFLSMWMSNTATTMMMIPIALSVIYKLEESLGESGVKKYSVGLLLAIAYASSIGGIATLIGTPPNLSFARIFAIMFPAAPEVSFASWMAFALPVTVIMFFVLWALIFLMFRPKKHWDGLDSNVFKKEYKKLGPASFEEKTVFILFIILAALWIFRENITLGSFVVPGWSALFKNPEYFNDGTAAIFIAIILFSIPSKSKGGERIMEWNTAKKLPWGIVLLFGGGFALAKAFVVSGLSIWVGEQLVGLSSVHPGIIVAGITTLMSMLTELTSNTATTEMILPIVSSISVSIKINPLLFMLPATLAASLAFMLPVATPPNAIIFGTNRLKIKDMVKAGILLNVAGIIVITLITYFWAQYIFDIDLSIFPEWAKAAMSVVPK